jgi:hypothetical protein
MNNFAPDLSVFNPFFAAVIVVATLGAVLSIGILGQALASTVVRHHRTRIARHESIPAYYGHLLVPHTAH